VLLSAAPAAADAPPPPPDTIPARAPYGPAADAEAACKAAPLDGHYEGDLACAVGKLKAKVKLKAPYQKLGYVERESSSMGEGLLAIQMADQWYLARLSEWSTDGADHGGVTVKSIKLKDVIPGGAPELLVTGSLATLGFDHEYAEFGTTYDMLWVCSVGASGTPSCAEVVVGLRFRPHPMGEGKRFSIKLRHKFEKDGRLTRKVRGKWPKKKVMGDGEVAREDFEGTDTLVFP
jgi:hypothetical protein